MAEQNGLKQADHDLLKRALKTHEHVTGEKVTHLADSIPVVTEEDPKAKAKAAQKAYEDNAKLTSRVEQTQQAERQARAAAAAPAGAASPAESPSTPSNVQPGNPGGGQEAMATDRAKEQGFDRKGDEPSTAQPSH